MVLKQGYNSLELAEVFHRSSQVHGWVLAGVLAKLVVEN